MGRLFTKSRKGKKTKPFDPKRDYLDQAVRDYLQKGGKITRIVDETETYDPSGRFPDSIPYGDEIMTGL